MPECSRTERAEEREENVKLGEENRGMRGQRGAILITLLW